MKLALGATPVATYYYSPTGGVGYTPDGTIPDGCIPCTQAQYQNPNQYYIDNTTTPPTIQPISQASALTLAQAQQIVTLSQDCQNQIYAGYTSNALGSAFLYPSKDTDQTNMLSSLLAAVATILFDAEPWAPNTNVVEGQVVWVGRQIYEVTSNGVTGAEAPNWPITSGNPVLDGSAQWDLWTTPFWCADMSVTPPSWAWRNHTARQMWQAGKDAKAAVLNNMGMNALLGEQVLEALTIQAVQGIKWP
jgi:hypothetical protein